MTTPTLHVVARIVAQAGCEAGLRSVLLDLVNQTRQEAGCIRYDLFQNPARLVEFVTIEEWQDEAAIATHLAGNAVQSALARSASLLAIAPEIVSYVKISA
ncbi:putative quinol monooxygenase [Thermoleptolyngbya sp. C42_A2020_037]|uniref:putative quinol monooxygenase n=1 Tax=Thermoleptolyngbya sp. C42_A2020_037 TaxID=2747799 RepID=UPI0019EF8CBE|nr:putative quinol monooxygenase [Thermoleptolyngbya sp. C42_A2020_037]MBF2084892.1 antibiotic biosynthesis monooxygenase [Thermoleptolyngbya sp. C42_A2020_037]